MTTDNAPRTAWIRPGIGGWLTLRFKALPRRFDHHQEREYRVFYAGLFARLRANASAIGLVMWLSFLLWDLIRSQLDPAFREQAPVLAAMRLFTALLWGVAHWHTTKPRFAVDDDFANRVLLYGVMQMYIGMCALTVIAPPAYRLPGFVIGMMVCLSGMFGLFALRIREGLMLALVVSQCNVITVMWCDQQAAAAGDQLNISWLTLIFLACFTVVGITLCAIMETITRRLFESRTALAATSAEAADRLSALIEMKEQLRVEADRRNRDKSLFIASAVHDLRQPVQALCSALPPLVHAVESANVAGARLLLEVSQKSTDMLRNQLGAILDISRIEAGETLADVQAVDVTAIVHSVVDLAQPTAGARMVSLTCVLPPAPATALTDGHFVRRIVMNLVDNGIKYAAPNRHEGCFVQVGVHVGPTFVEISVQDNGVGIDAKLLRNGEIFSPFVQVEHYQPEGERGVGLGLAIVKGLIRRLPEHSIEVDSVVGQGSSFRVRLPCAGEPTPVDGGAVRRSDLPVQQVLEGRFILFVEDDAMVLAATRAMLQGLGAVCEAFSDFDAFRDALDDIDRVPDLVLSDYRLPQGRTALDVIGLTATHYGEVPCVILSGSAIGHEVLEQLSGATVLRKPVDQAQLLSTLRAVMRAQDLD